MAAAKAVLTPNRLLRELGFAIQEVRCNHIPTMCEKVTTQDTYRIHMAD